MFTRGMDPRTFERESQVRVLYSLLKDVRKAATGTGGWDAPPPGPAEDSPPTKSE